LFAQLTLAVLISRLIALLIGTTFHEYMHNYIGWLMGDNTPASQGRLTLDPMKHIYWPGFLMFVVVGFGVLGTAPISMANMNYPRVKWGERLSRVQRFGLAVLAGPVGNLIVAAVFAILVRLIIALVPDILTVSYSAQMARVFPTPARILIDLVWWNVLLFFFNLIPLGPLDGRYILRMFLPPASQFQYENFQNQYGMMALFGLIFVSFLIPGANIFGTLIGGPTQALTTLLLGF
jgi:Zn-dependent protease